MNLYRTRTCFILLISTVILSCNHSSEPKKKADEITEITIDSLTAFTTFDTHGIAGPTLVEVLENGHIAVGDFDQMKVFLVKNDGELITSFGREGRGPEEFIRIQKLIGTSVLNVVDTDQTIVSQFDFQGNFINSYPFKPTGVNREIALIDDSVFVQTTGGIDEALLSITDLTQDSIMKFGKPNGISQDEVDFQESLAQLKSGEIPDLHKNMANLRSDGNHIYAYLQSFSELRKYDLSGNLVWERTLNFPYNQTIFDQAVEQAIESPGGLPAINYISDYKVIRNEVYFLSYIRSRDDNQLLIKLSEEGIISMICTFPSDIGFVYSFDISVDDNMLYLASSGDGILYQVELPFQ